MKKASGYGVDRHGGCYCLEDQFRHITFLFHHDYEKGPVIHKQEGRT